MFWCKWYKTWRAHHVCCYLEWNLYLFLTQLEVGPSPSKKSCIIFFNESPSKMMKNAFYFILKALFVLNIFKFLSWILGPVEKSGLARNTSLISKFMTSQTEI